MNGIIIVDKPAGMTSFDVVSRLRKITGERRIGHAGTLDPMATGVLPVFLGAATRVISLLPDHDKRYEAAFRLGVTTDTGDITGRVLATAPVRAGGAEEIRQALEELRGEGFQIPPMYSAIRQNGRRLYELARSGVEVEREPRRVNLYELRLGEQDPQTGDWALEVFCSAGTYIRTVITDIGEKLGCGAVMTALRRTYAAGFGIADAQTLQSLADAAERGALPDCVLSAEQPFGTLPEVGVTQKQAVRFLNGGALALDRLAPLPHGGLVRVKSGGVLLGLGEIHEEKQELAIKCLLKGGPNRLENHHAGE